MRHLGTAILASTVLASWSGAALAEERDFNGLKLGVGLSLTLDTGSHDRVNDAELVNGIVRVKDEDNARARIMLESHYFFAMDNCPTPAKLMAGARCGMGPFVAIQPGDKEIVQAAALGWMFGFERLGPKGENTGKSWNIGIGAVFDPNTKTLGDGLEPNKPLPAGETTIRYKERAQKGVVILTSFTF